MATIKFDDVSIYYGNNKKRKYVIENLSTVFEDGKINVILGDSGCGKTTLLKSLVEAVGFDGEIYFDGKNADDILVNKRGVSFVSQNINLFPYLTIFDNIAFPLKVKKYKPEDILTKVRAIAELLGIEHCLNQRPRKLSIGQQQRAMIAREMVSNPSVLLLDEPFSNLNPDLRKELNWLVKDICEQLKTTVIFVTHSYDEAINLADVLYIMDEGHIIATGTPRELIKSNNPYLQVMHDADYAVGRNDEEEKNR